jgi:hypothetical protein
MGRFLQIFLVGPTKSCNHVVDIRRIKLQFVPRASNEVESSFSPPTSEPAPKMVALIDAMILFLPETVLFSDCVTRNPALLRIFDKISSMIHRLAH